MATMVAERPDPFQQRRLPTRFGTHGIGDEVRFGPSAIECLCGRDHDVSPTSYGWRALCADLGCRWTLLHSEAGVVAGIQMRVVLWTFEPYVPMTQRLPGVD